MKSFKEKIGNNVELNKDVVNKVIDATLSEVEKKIGKLRALWSNDHAYTINETLDEVQQIIKEMRK